MQRLGRRLSLVRHHPLLLVAGVTALWAVSTVPAAAQTHPQPLPYHTGYAQWYPYPHPFFGFPPGAVLPDHIVVVRLQVTPREALVFVDGYAAGRVDEYDGVFQRLRLVPGPHEIVIYHPGLRTLRQNLYYNPGSTHTIRHRLDALLPGEAPEPQPVPRPLPPQPGMSPPQGAAPAYDPSRTGALVLRVQPDDATVLIDGEPWKGPASSDRLVIQLAEGSHRVRIEKPGFQPFSVDVDVRAGETTSFNVSLIP
jgi:PEGA domain-containing protein